MRIERVTAPRRNLPYLTCGCLALFAGTLAALVIGALVLLPSLPNIAAQVIGFTSSGDVDQVFVESSVPPAPALQNAQPVDQVTLDLGTFGQQTFNSQPQLYEFSVGSVGTTQTQAATITFTESGLTELCRQRTTVCNNDNPQYRNVEFDLRPNGLVVYADATLPQLGGAAQRIGAVLRVDSSARRFDFIGVDINGALFTNPPPELTATVNDLERGANDVLTALTLQADGSQYSLSRITIDDTTATLFLQ